MAYSGFLGIIILINIKIVFSADPKVKIQQTYPKTTIVDGYPTLVAEKNKDVFIACVVSNKPKNKPVQWILQNYQTNIAIPISTDTDVQNAFKYQIDKPASNNYRLKISNLQLSDQALYICRVQLHGGFQMANGSRVIKVIQKPQIIDEYTSSDTTIDEGERTEFKCAADGIPKPLIKWELAGGGILPTGGREYTAPSLLIDNVDKSHRGHYKCIAQNTAGTDVRRIALNVNFPPRITAKLQEVYQAVGYSRELKCEVSGNPVSTKEQLAWYKDGVLLTDTNKYTFESFIGSNYVLMDLTIHNIDRDDFGQYRCYAENAQGGGEDFVYLIKSDHFNSDRPT